MKTKIIFSFLLAVSLASCSFSKPNYVPSSENIDIAKYGSHIEIKKTNNLNIEGEFIAVDDYNFIVYDIRINACVITPMSQMRKFKISYAQPKNYSWTTGVYSLATLSHGFFLIATLPINIAVTSIVTVGGKNAFTYTNEDLTYEELKMFTRFPQGLPPNVDLSKIQGSGAMF